MTLRCCPWVWWQPQCSEPRRWKVLVKTAGSLLRARALGAGRWVSERLPLSPVSAWRPRERLAEWLAQACTLGTARGWPAAGLCPAAAGGCAGALPGAAQSPGLWALLSPRAWGAHVPMSGGEICTCSGQGGCMVQAARAGPPAPHFDPCPADGAQCAGRVHGPAPGRGAERGSADRQAPELPDDVLERSELGAGRWEGLGQQWPEHLGQHWAAGTGGGNRPAGGAAESPDHGRQGTGPGALAVTQAEEIKAAPSRSPFCWLHRESRAAGAEGLPGALPSRSWPSPCSHCELAHE